MRLPGHRRLRMAGRWLRSLRAGGALILGYHRIASPEDDPLDLGVHPRCFDEQLAVLRQVARPMPLACLIRGLAAGDLPARAVAITFDDGYVDNLSEALPRLERYEIPATFFVVSGALGREFWWDEAARLLRNTPTGRAPLREEVARWTHLPDGERAARLDALRARPGTSHTDAPGASALGAPELRELAGSTLVEIGAHSVSHPMLATLSRDAQQREIKGSKTALEALLDRPVHGFSYPNGSASAATRSIVRDSGFRYACTSDSDVARAGTDPYHLPRFWVRDWDGDRFARWLRWWLRG